MSGRRASTSSAAVVATTLQHAWQRGAARGAGAAKPAVSLAVSLVISLACAGCGKTPAAASRPAPSGASVETGGQSAADVAQQARGALTCPASVQAAARPADAPVDDVLGVRPGLGYDDAMHLVLCSHPLLVATPQSDRGFTLKTGGQQVRQGFEARFAEPRVNRTGKQIVQEMQREAMGRGMNAVRRDVQPGQSKWFVGTMGLPGQEQVLSVAREERFAPDQLPTADAVMQALRKKYGVPTDERPAGQVTTLRWAHDPQGRLITDGSPLFQRCHGAANPDDALTLSPQCGTVVAAQLVLLATNAQLVETLRVGVVDQAGGDRRIAETEQALQQRDQQRRAQEVEQAAKNTKAPAL